MILAEVKDKEQHMNIKDKFIQRMEQTALDKRATYEVDKKAYLHVMSRYLNKYANSIPQPDAIPQQQATNNNLPTVMGGTPSGYTPQSPAAVDAAVKQRVDATPVKQPKPNMQAGGPAMFSDPALARNLQSFADRTPKTINLPSSIAPEGSVIYHPIQRGAQGLANAIRRKAIKFNNASVAETYPVK